ncbi:MAG: T9SS type A sorting domain-containing protein, partial [candidate division Zixibacteria bacterium]|nr:T9SS type A sorting domain-containing protein [candidate division Zixibacteria bacterium]
PNPFNPTTTIEFYTDRSVHVNLHIFNILGQRIRTLMDAPLEIGKHSVVWDGRDDGGNDVASGMYFYRIQAGSNVQTRKMVKLK